MYFVSLNIVPHERENRPNLVLGPPLVRAPRRTLVVQRSFVQNLVIFLAFPCFLVRRVDFEILQDGLELSQLLK